MVVMQRGVSVLFAVLVVTSMAAMAPLGAAQTHEDGASEGDANDVRPGERLAGVVGVQGAEIDGELESRTFGIKVAQAATDEARADVVAEQLERNERRLDELSERQHDLHQQQEAGEISNGTFRAEIARTVVETENAKRTTNQSADAAAELPEDLLTERGVDAARIQTLQTRANELSGPEVAEIARGIAGERTGAPIGPDRGDRPGVDGDRPGSDSDRPGPGSDRPGPADHVQPDDDPA